MRQRPVRNRRCGNTLVPGSARIKTTLPAGQPYCRTIAEHSLVCEQDFLFSLMLCQYPDHYIHLALSRIWICIVCPVLFWTDVCVGKGLVGGRRDSADEKGTRQSRALLKINIFYLVQSGNVYVPAGLLSEGRFKALQGGGFSMNKEGILRPGFDA